MKKHYQKPSKTLNLFILKLIPFMYVRVPFQFAKYVQTFFSDF